MNMETEEQIRCAYCNAQRPKSEMHQWAITYRTGEYTPSGKYKHIIATKTNWYCKDKSCAMHDQFAHEG